MPTNSIALEIKPDRIEPGLEPVRPRDQVQTELYVAEVPATQFAADVTLFEIAVPRPMAASAMALPTIARINAYSAAEAPLSSVHRFFR